MEGGAVLCWGPGAEPEADAKPAGFFPTKADGRCADGRTGPSGEDFGGAPAHSGIQVKLFHSVCGWLNSPFLQSNLVPFGRAIERPSMRVGVTLVSSMEDSSVTRFVKVRAYTPSPLCTHIRNCSGSCR